MSGRMEGVRGQEWRRERTNWQCDGGLQDTLFEKKCSLTNLCNICEPAVAALDTAATPPPPHVFWPFVLPPMPAPLGCLFCSLPISSPWLCEMSSCFLSHCGTPIQRFIVFALRAYYWNAWQGYLVTPLPWAVHPSGRRHVDTNKAPRPPR